MTVYCSFCGKSQHEVYKLFAGIGPKSFICNECATLCVNLMLEDLKNPDDMITKLNKWVERNKDLT